MLGKSMYIWNIEDIFGGNTDRIVSELKAGKYESVILHSTNVHNWRTAKRVELANKLKAAGIKVFAGAAVYFGTEGNAAAGICTQYKLAGFVFDAESAFDKLSTPDSKATNMLKEFRKAAPGCLIGWCWWAFWHKMNSTGTVYHPPKILWAAMAKGYGGADFGVPMMYWSWGDSAARATAYLDESWSQWRAITNKPIEPAGRAYVGDGGKATPEAVVAFEKRARELGATGVTWWFMDHAVKQDYVPGVWDALKGLQPFTDTGDEPQPKWYENMTLDEIITVLKAHPEWQPESKG